MPDKDYRLHCKDCDSYKQCDYYHRRRGTSCICKEYQPITGAWKETILNGDQFGYVCNRCGYTAFVKHKYCPECGTQMRWIKHMTGAVEVTVEWMNEKVKGLM